MPLIAPVLVLMLSPGGSPSAVYLMVPLEASVAAKLGVGVVPSLLVWLDATAEKVPLLLLSLAAICTSTGSPELLVRLPGLVTTTVPEGLMYQLKTSMPVLVPSVTVMIGV